MPMESELLVFQRWYLVPLSCSIIWLNYLISLYIVFLMCNVERVITMVRVWQDLNEKLG